MVEQIKVDSGPGDWTGVKGDRGTMGGQCFPLSSLLGHHMSPFTLSVVFVPTVLCPQYRVLLCLRI